MNIIIANNIDSQQYKIKVGMDRAQFMIRTVHGVPIDIVSYIFTQIRSEAHYIMTDILPFEILITRFLLAVKVLLDFVERARESIGWINSSTLSAARITKLVETQGDVHPRDHGVSVGEKLMQEASYTTIRKENADIIRAESHA